MEYNIDTHSLIVNSSSVRFMCSQPMAYSLDPEPRFCWSSMEPPNLEKVYMTHHINMKDEWICVAAGGDQLLGPGQEPDQHGQQDGGGGHIWDGV